MKSSRFLLSSLIAFGLICLCTSMTSAQVIGPQPKTWIAHDGSDANASLFVPCTRTSPCSTLGVTILQTRPGGEIDIADSTFAGQFGGFIIDKALTIDGTGSVSALTANLNADAMVINAGPNDVVVIKGLTINGNYLAGKGTNGIRIVSAKAVYIEDVTIQNFAVSGINIQPASGTINVTLNNVRLINNATGLLASGATSHVITSNSSITGNTTGIGTSGSAMVALTRTMVFANTTGLAGPNILTYGDNTIAGNNMGNAATGTMSHN